MTKHPLKRDLWEVESQVDAAMKHMEIAVSIIRELIGDPKLKEVKTSLKKWKSDRKTMMIHGKRHRHHPMKEEVPT